MKTITEKEALNILKPAGQRKEFYIQLAEFPEGFYVTVFDNVNCEECKISEPKTREQATKYREEILCKAK